MQFRNSLLRSKIFYIMLKTHILIAETTNTSAGLIIVLTVEIQINKHFLYALRVCNYAYYLNSLALYQNQLIAKSINLPNYKLNTIRQ